MKRTDIINELIAMFNYETYLEIGVRNPDDNFNKIKCKNKIGVDPDFRAKPTHLMTSDQFFAENNKKFDLIFIDGLHTEFQARCDIVNAFHCLTKNGTIVIHDCNPTSEAMQKVPPVQEQWTGDVWKAFIYFRTSVVDLNMFVIDTDYGVGIIRFGSQDLLDLPHEDVEYPSIIQYEHFKLNRQEWLNLVSPENWKSKL